MKILPAIDIKDKKCIRLVKGDFDNKTEYKMSPVDQAGKYKDCGFKNIHIVDLDGALTGETVNLDIIKEWVSNSHWASFLCDDEKNLSSTSICLKLVDPIVLKLPLEIKNELEKKITNLLESENVAYDVGSYRSAPPGLRIWGGPTVESDDIKKLLPWLDWAYETAIKEIKVN